MITTADNYRALLAKLILLRARWVNHRAVHRAAAADESFPPYSRMASRSKAKVIGSHVGELDFILSKNRKEIAAFDLEPEFQAARGPSTAA